MKLKHLTTVYYITTLAFLLNSCSHVNQKPVRSFASVANLQADTSLDQNLIGLFQEFVQGSEPKKFRFKVCSLLEAPRITVTFMDYFASECKVHHMYIGKSEGYSLKDLERIDRNINKNIKKVIKEGLINGLVIMAAAAGTGAMYGTVSLPGPGSLVGAGGGLIVGAGAGVYLTYQDYKDAKASTSSFKEFTKEISERLSISKISNTTLDDIKKLESIMTSYDY